MSLGSANLVEVLQLNSKKYDNIKKDESENIKEDYTVELDKCYANGCRKKISFNQYGKGWCSHKCRKSYHVNYEDKRNIKISKQWCIN